MNKNLKIIIFGLLIWLIPTIISFLISYLNILSLFDIIVAVVVAATVIGFSYLYFKDIDGNFVREGIIIGVIWVLVSIILDLVLIILGVTKLSLANYAIYVAPVYIIIPAITIGFGLYKDQNKQDKG
ncbi:MAG: hypothetical protein A4E27_00381 [Methanobacterium sp. PtaU1.Bin242]|nr:MAG: hypothetical protein A4E27_00381 [Methanobacterium sp. PtaU1.Bin242]